MYKPGLLCRCHTIAQQQLSHVSIIDQVLHLDRIDKQTVYNEQHAWLQKPKDLKFKSCKDKQAGSIQGANNRLQVRAAVSLQGHKSEHGSQRASSISGYEA